MLKHTIVLAVICTLSGCLTTPPVGAPDADGFVRVTDEATFRAAVVDRRLEWEEDAALHFQLNSDGSITGEFRRGALVGEWEFVDGYWCRSFERGVREESLSYDCQTAEVSPTAVRLTRERGNSYAGVYNIR